jgi:thiamine transport system substrate-binding protein
MTNARNALLLTALLGTALAAGCTNPLRDPPAGTYAELGFAGDPTGRDTSRWPDLHGAKVRVLDNGAFSYAFADAKRAFERLTNGTVERVEGGDAGSALRRAIDGDGDPPADVIYGIDNAYYGVAADAGILRPYKPVHAFRLDPAHVFFAGGRDLADVPEAEWLATPADYGFVAVNYDARELEDIDSLHEVRDHADAFVTSDPSLSSPGMGFLLATIATFGEDGVYDWKAYWADLWEGGVLVTDDWGTAYEQHFSAGYNSPDVVDGPEAGKGDRAIVVSYSESPAYEAFYGRDPEDIAEVLTAPGSTFKQVQTMAILRGTPEPIAAQAWIEFTLTDEYQRLAAPSLAVYPVVQWQDVRVDPDQTYGDLDPEPSSLRPADFDWRYVGDHLEQWLCEWNAVKERDSAGLTLCLQG